MCLQGSAPASAASYSAEFQAILSAVHAVPADVPLLVRPPVRVAPRVYLMDNAYVSGRGRKSSSCAVFLPYGCRQVPCQNTTCSLPHWSSYVLSRGNELADKLAAVTVAILRPPFSPRRKRSFSGTWTTLMPDCEACGETVPWHGRSVAQQRLGYPAPRAR